jgi:hypothetical protein
MRVINQKRLGGLVKPNDPIRDHRDDICVLVRPYVGEFAVDGSTSMILVRYLDGLECAYPAHLLGLTVVE